MRNSRRTETARRSYLSAVSEESKFSISASGDSVDQSSVLTEQISNLEARPLINQSERPTLNMTDDVLVSNGNKEKRIPTYGTSRSGSFQEKLSSTDDMKFS